MSKELKHIRASETALGVMPLGVESKAQAQLRGAWEARFAPLGLALPEKEPPADAWYLVRSTIERSADRQTVAKTKRGIWRWRWMSLLLGGLAAALAAYILANGIGFNQSGQKQSADTPSAAATATPFVAVATPDGSKEALILELDPKTETARIRPVGLTVPEDRDLEMWRVTSSQAPESLGLIDASKETTIPLKLDAGDTIAITSEPKGGSSTGAPSGPTVYSAPLIATPE